MNIRSAKSKTTGKFTVTVWDWTGAVFYSGEFDDIQEADASAVREERAMTMQMVYPSNGPEMTIDEIMAELEA
jgi:ABC-type microcin C transport system duplicated ATPase subunit YejF